MKVVGPLTHARFAAEISRIIRHASKWVAHETLRLHAGVHKPDELVSEEDRIAFLNEMDEALKAIRK